MGYKKSLSFFTAVDNDKAPRVLRMSPMVSVYVFVVFSNKEERIIPYERLRELEEQPTELVANYRRNEWSDEIILYERGYYAEINGKLFSSEQLYKISEKHG